MCVISFETMEEQLRDYKNISYEFRYENEKEVVLTNEEDMSIVSDWMKALFYKILTEKVLKRKIFNRESIPYFPKVIFYLSQEKELLGFSIAEQ